MHGEPAEVKPMLSLCKNEIDVLKFSIQSWCNSSFSVPQLWSVSLLFKGFSTTFIQYIQQTEVTANQLKSNRCFHCARLKSMYLYSVSTFGAHFQFQYHCWKEIVYFSRDFSTAFIHIIQYTECTANQLKSNRCFHCARMKSMYWDSVSNHGALLHFQYHSCEEIVYFSRDLSTAFIHIIQYTEVTANQLKSNDAFIVQEWNRCTEIQYPLLGHFFIFSTTAVKW